MKTCSKCGIEKEESCFWVRNNRKSGVNSECKECAKKRRTEKYRNTIEETRKKRNLYYARNREKLCRAQVENQKGNKRYREYQNKYYLAKIRSGDKKYTARRLLQVAVKEKMILRPNSCSECKSEGNIEGHHADYDKPLDVIWLCVLCHRALHKRLKEEEKQNGSKRISQKTNDKASSR